VIGYLGQASKVVAMAPGHSLSRVLVKLRALGSVDGQNLRAERQFAGGRLEDLSALAAELIMTNPRVVAVETRGICGSASRPRRRHLRATIQFGSANVAARRLDGNGKAGFDRVLGAVILFSISGTVVGIPDRLNGLALGFRGALQGTRGPHADQTRLLQTHANGRS
jgi:hypothetical protein